MSNTNSKEQTIYRSLAGKIQLGFFDDGERFPSAKEIAERYRVSYCPAQRALKMLERDGLIQLNRGKNTIILGKPYENYLESDVFKRRAAALSDLLKSLDILSPAICLQSLLHCRESLALKKEQALPGRSLYQQFERSLHSLGSQTALSLYYDISSVAESALLDILCLKLGKKEAEAFLHAAALEYTSCFEDFTKESAESIGHRLEHLSETFRKPFEEYLAELERPPDIEPEAFVWEPNKGRTRYCDIVAIDMICKINQGIYPLGTLLPGGPVLADTYHVSEITIRRTIGLLNTLGVVQTINGVGTRVIGPGDASIPYRLKELMLDGNLKAFLEALQLLAVTGKPVFLYTFPWIPEEVLAAIAGAAAIPEEKSSMVAVISAGMQAVVHYCPLAAVRDIYSKLTLLLLKGSILRLEETGAEKVPGWSFVSAELQESCSKKDGVRLADAYRQLFQMIFTDTRLTLIDIGVHGAAEVAGI